MILGDGAGAVGFQQEQQVVHSGLEGFTFVGLADTHPGLQLFEHHAVAGDVVVLVDGIPLAGEGLVGDDAVVPGIVDQGIAGDAGGGLVGPAEAAVDDQQLAAALDGAFALLGLYGDMTVDDMAVFAFQPEFLQNPVADCGILVVGVVGILGFCPGFLKQSHRRILQYHLSAPILVLHYSQN